MAIETLNIDGEEIKTADLPQEIQRLISIYETTYNKRVEVENEYIMLSSALRQISNDIVVGVREKKKTNEQQNQQSQDIGLATSVEQ